MDIDPNVRKIIHEVKTVEKFNPKRYRKILGKYPKPDGLYSKEEIIRTYRQLCEEEGKEPEKEVLSRIQAKPTRTISGVVPVTVLTKPFPCPGKCVFCPTDVRMPKSYLRDEPGAMRAEMNHFDPYRQVKMRIRAFHNNAHSTDKIELLILGGTWSAYPDEYKIWFVKRCFDAMNEENGEDTSESATWEELEEAHKKNVEAKHRCIGLSIETRPDWITPDEIKFIRRLGGTKVQIGIQSMSDEINDLNKRGHSVEQTRRAFTLLRKAGFKIHGHWMANLLGATPASDKDDFKKIFSDEGIKPDELKIYPTILVKNAELYDYYKRGEYKPYSRTDLMDVVLTCLPHIPRYTRVNRLFRDFPTPNIVDGEKHINFRQLVEQEAEKQGVSYQCIRTREIRNEDFNKNAQPIEEIIEYKTLGSRELFISYNTADDKLLGFLRLSLPDADERENHFIKELEGAAIIREVHVYGPAQKISEPKQDKAVQHKGLGTRLIERAKQLVKENNFNRLAVISAVGTRKYYEKRGFRQTGLYHLKTL